MAYTEVPTVTTGEVWTAADHNTYIKDNFAAGVPDIFTTKGDLAVGTGANAASRLAIGTAGQYLVTDSDEATGLKWYTFPEDAITARYSRTDTAEIANNTVTIVDYDVSDWDSDSRVTTGASWKFDASGTERFLVLASLRIENSVEWTLGEAAALYCYVSDTLYCVLDYIEHLDGAGGAIACHLHGATLVECADTDFINIRVKQVSGETLGIHSDGDYNYAGFYKLK